MKFLNAKRIDACTVEATHEIEGKEVTVEWCNIQVDGSVGSFDLQLDVECDDPELSERIENAISNGESDDNRDVEIYLHMRDSFDKYDAEGTVLSEMDIDDFSIEFDDEVEETFVVRVENHTTISTFLVNCQFSEDHNYTLTTKLSCHNESGGDFYDSGLEQFLDRTGYNDDSFKEKLAARIEACAQLHVGDTSVKGYLENKTDLTLTYKKCLANACYANNCSLSKYVADSGEIVISAEDDNEKHPELIVEKYRVFANAEEYKKWFDDATEGWQGNWAQDCGLALKLREAL